MLWVNLIMDTLASLALATELPTPDLLQRKPYGRKKPMISRTMIQNILGQAFYMILVIFVILYAGDKFLNVESGITDSPSLSGEPTEHFTIIFNVFVMMTLFNEINARKIHGERNIFKGLLTNPVFYGIMIFCAIAQVLIIEFGGRVFMTAPLSIVHWLWSILFGSSVLLWGQVITSIPNSWIPKNLFNRKKPNKY